MAIILTLLLHLSHLFQCIAIFSTNFFGLLAKKTHQKADKTGPKAHQWALAPVKKQKTREQEKKIFIMLFVYFWGVLQNQDEHF